MRIAITYDLSNNTVWQHFGQTTHFMLVDLPDEKRMIITNSGYSHKDLIPYLKDLDVELLICGGLGNMAYSLLSDAGIKVVPGITGDINDVLDLYKKGQLKGNKNVLHDCDCGHHHG